MKKNLFRRVSASGARLAQLAEHYLDTVGVKGSSPLPRTIFDRDCKHPVILSGHLLLN
jgi:hypothetical protein